jgi:hypothetical protein
MVSNFARVVNSQHLNHAPPIQRAWQATPPILILIHIHDRIFSFFFSCISRSFFACAATEQFVEDLIEYLEGSKPKSPPRRVSPTPPNRRFAAALSCVFF